MHLPPFTLSDEEAYQHLAKSLDHMLRRDDVPLKRGERGRLYGWYWGYLGRAAVDLYAATGESRYGLLAQRISQALLEERDDQIDAVDETRQIVFPGWGTRYTNNIRANEITTSGLIALPMLELAKMENLKWLADAATESLLAFRDERLIRNDDEYYFTHLTDGVVEALNHSALYGAALTKASSASNDSWLMETALGLFRYHLHFTDVRGSGISWPYAPEPGADPKSLPSEAMWKAAASIELPIALAEEGVPEAIAFLNDVARTQLDNPVFKEGGYPQFIGHDRSVSIVDREISPGLTSFLASFLQIPNTELQQMIFTVMAEHPQFFPRGWRGGSRAMMMAWGHLRKQHATE